MMIFFFHFLISFVLIFAFPFSLYSVKKSVIRQDLQAHAHSLWGLLPAFCRYPIDTHKKFKALAELLIDILKEDSLMHENIAVAIQVFFSSLSLLFLYF